MSNWGTAGGVPQSSFRMRGSIACAIVLWWPSTPGRHYCLDCLSDSPIDCGLERSPIELERQTSAKRQLAVLSAQQRLGQGNGRVERRVEFDDDPVGQCNVVDACGRNSPQRTLPSALDPWDVEMREEIVDPFSLTLSRISCNINMIRYHK